MDWLAKPHGLAESYAYGFYRRRQQGWGQRSGMIGRRGEG